MNVSQKGTSLGLAVAACVAACAPFTTGFEGTVLNAYYDPAHIPTECTGETQNVRFGVTFTRDECAAMLRNRLAKDYAPKVIACVPGLGHPARLNVFVASLDASYNAGPGAFCKSPMAERFRAKDWRGGCARFVGWRRTAKGQELPGLVSRRRKEAALCMKGV